MTFLAPAFFVAALAVAVGVIAVHFISTRQPDARVLPTVRFVPDSSDLTVVTASPPEDIPLLALRVLLILLAGAACARPIVTFHRRTVARVIVADVSRAVARIGEVRDSVRGLYAAGDALVVFDTAARAIAGSVRDSIDRLPRSEADGALSPAFIAALRAGAARRTEADSVELIVVAAFAAAQIDDATAAIRELWPGRARLIHVTRRADTVDGASALAVGGAADDPVRLAARLLGADEAQARVRIVRGAQSASDSAWAGAGHTLIRWPADGEAAGWLARSPIDTVGAIIADGVALVAPFERHWRPDSIRAGTRVVARWVDGEPAAVERRVGGGCIRDVAVAVPVRGDLILRPSFGRLLRTLSAPCGGGTGDVPLPPKELAMLAGSGPLATAARMPRPDIQRTPLVPWLLAAALAAALLELRVRRRRSIS